MDDDWNPAAYDEHHGYVHAYGEDLLSLLDPGPEERVLDLGCGTGHLAAEIDDRGSSVVGLDRSGAMLAEARATYPDLDFVRGDARALPFDSGIDSGIDSALDTGFDAVLSNAALHWIPSGDHGAVLDSLGDVLTDGGRLVAEMGGIGNVERVVSSTLSALRKRGFDADHPWYFPSVGEYAARLERHGFEVRYARLFDRPTELEAGDEGLRNWLSTFCESIFADVPADEREPIVAAVEDRLREELYDGETWTVDYRRLRFVAVRTDE